MNEFQSKNLGIVSWNQKGGTCLLTNGSGGCEVETQKKKKVLKPQKQNYEGPKYMDKQMMFVLCCVVGGLRNVIQDLVGITKVTTILTLGSASDWVSHGQWGFLVLLPPFTSPPTCSPNLAKSSLWVITSPPT